MARCPRHDVFSVFVDTIPLPSDADHVSFDGVVGGGDSEAIRPVQQQGMKFVFLLGAPSHRGLSISQSAWIATASTSSQSAFIISEFDEALLAAHCPDDIIAFCLCGSC